MLAKDFTFEIKDVSQAGEFEGYASTFGGSPDAYGDIVAPGAFVESLAKHRREGTMTLMLFGHNSSDVPIGNWNDLAEDGKGLYVKGAIDLEDPEALRVYRAIKRKSVRGLSIGYEVKQSTNDPKRPGVTTLDQVELWEVSIVNFPANRRSLVTDVKSETKDLRDRLVAGDRLTEREWERLLKKDFGLSNSEAERAVRINLKNGQGDPVVTAEADGSKFMQALLAG